MIDVLKPKQYKKHDELDSERGKNETIHLSDAKRI